MLSRIILFGAVFCCAVPLFADEVLFQIGRPDGFAAEFRYELLAWLAQKQDGSDHTFIVGKSRTAHWPPQHYSTREMDNAGQSIQFEIEFDAEKNYPDELYFILGYCHAHPTDSPLVHVSINGHNAEPVRLPKSPGAKPNPARSQGFYEALVIPIAKDVVKQGKNSLTIRLSGGGWLYYDYLRLATAPTIPEQLPPLVLPPVDLKQEFRAGPMKEVDEILFVVRKPGIDPHWYANFSYYAHDANAYPFPMGAGSWMNILSVETGEVRTIFKDEEGTIRDPQIHYDGKRIIFSYQPAGKLHFNLYEINIDGTGLRQLTFGDWDDIEPTYTASGDIIFCSSRAKRWVQCWMTQVATLYKCGPNGENIRELSANVEQDNTPWPLPNGQILYTRWEYVDRSQMVYHHLWTMNPDGTRQMIYYGNQTPGIVMIDAKPIPNSNKVIAIFSPGHGRKDHQGRITLVDPAKGPDDPEGVFSISHHVNHADPWAFSEEAFMTVRNDRLELVDSEGREQTLYELPKDFKDQGFWIHEPRPVITRMPEKVIADLTDPTKSTGVLTLIDVYEGRKMQSVKRGSIKELLILETLPEPIHFQGGMDQISIGGTFTLERIIGTVPIEPDGSAFMELPALRSLLFVAMDHNGWPVKRMHSFTSVMPGEVSACIGCHEERMQTTPTHQRTFVEAMNRIPKRPEPITDIPEIFDFVRDIQPILDKHCVKCHNNETAEADVVLCGDWTPRFTQSYDTLARIKNMFGDNRNREMSNFKPYEIGSVASRLMKKIDEKHGDVAFSEHDRKMIKFWLEAGANYAGAYAANAQGQIGWVQPANVWHRIDLGWKETEAMSEAIVRRCEECHTKGQTLPHTASHREQNYEVHKVFNLSYPEKSRMLTAPLAQSAGGLQRCGNVVFADKNDVDYQTILAGIERARQYVSNTRPNAVPFFANEHYVREMIRYGILSPDHDYKTMPIDPFATERKYWESLWYVPRVK